MTNNEGFEEWDADFLDQLIQVEEMAISSTNPNPNPNPSINHQASIVLPPHDHRISYSPPRQLSQRIPDSNKPPLHPSSNGFAVSAPFFSRTPTVATESELDRLKRELGRVSTQLIHLEQECSELRKERDQKEEQLASVFSHIEAKEADLYHSKSTNIGKKNGVLVQNHPGIATLHQNKSVSNNQVLSQINLASIPCKAVGVQTESTHLSIKNDTSNQNISNKLLSIWGSHGQKLGRDLVSKLFVECAVDFQGLFGCLSSNIPSELSMETLAFESPEAAKVSHLYCVLTKISNGMVQLETLFEALLDLCHVQNVVVIHRSLRILHVVLNHVLSLERSSSRRSVLYSGITS